jgi:hypothetical protein
MDMRVYETWRNKKFLRIYSFVDRQIEVFHCRVLTNLSDVLVLYDQAICVRKAWGVNMFSFYQYSQTGSQSLLGKEY